MQIFLKQVTASLSQINSAVRSSSSLKLGLKSRLKDPLRPKGFAVYQLKYQLHKNKQHQVISVLIPLLKQNNTLAKDNKSMADINMQKPKEENGQMCKSEAEKEAEAKEQAALKRYLDVRHDTGSLSVLALSTRGGRHKADVRLRPASPKLVRSIGTKTEA